MLEADKVGDSDFAFLMSLNLRGRNWRAGCAICLTDKIMGTICGRGHTEIVVFRPCGHSVCARPCFGQIMDMHNLSLGPRIIKCGDQMFSVVRQ